MVLPIMQTRGVKTLDFAGTREEVYERDDWPREKFQVYIPRDCFDIRSTLRMTQLRSLDMDLKGMANSRRY